MPATAAVKAFAAAARPLQLLRFDPRFFTRNVCTSRALTVCAAQLRVHSPDEVHPAASRPHKNTHRFAAICALRPQHITTPQRSITKN
jgi:hypothetical protein